MFKKRISDKKDRIKNKSKEIRLSNNIISIDLADWERLLEKNGVTKFNIINCETVLFSSNLSHWRIEHDGCVATLWHESKDYVKRGNDRSSYHIQDVSDSIDYLIKQTKLHDLFEKKTRYG